jgi:P27 family predicted phage terminase small subunit
MGKRGPKPTPTKEKERLGNPGKRPLNKNEPQPTGQPEAPDYLDEYAQQIWHRVIVAMAEGVYTACDTELLGAYCSACSLHRQAAQQIKENGLNIENKVNPWVQEQRRQAQLIATLGTRLGLDPAARSSINIPEQKPKGKFGEYGVVNGGKK